MLVVTFILVCAVVTYLACEVIADHIAGGKARTPRPGAYRDESHCIGIWGKLFGHKYLKAKGGRVYHQATCFRCGS